MMHSPVLLNIAFRATALTTLLVVASGSLPAVSNEDPSSVAKCAFTFQVVYPYDEEKDPYPICFSNCLAENEEWSEGVPYKHYCEVKGQNIVVEATFLNGELESCQMVPLLTDEELKARQAALQETLDACHAKKEEESPISSFSKLRPAPDKLSGFTWVDHSFYLVSPTSLSGQDGAAFCKKHAESLAVIESEEEQSVIQEVLSFDVWIGLSNVMTEGTFASPPLPRADYTNWAREQPANGNGKDHDCTMMTAKLDFRWVNASCDLEKRALCEWLPGRAPRYSCPANSHMFKTSHCFHVSERSVNGGYSQGVDYCTSRGMTLASIHSQEEQNFVTGLLTGYVWIGMDDNGREGDFRWIDGTPRDYTNFASGQPDNNGGSENCVLMYSGGGGDGDWYDYRCDSVQRVLCKSAASVE